MRRDAIMEGVSIFQNSENAYASVASGSEYG